MAKQHSKKFWITFVLVSALFLVSLFVFLEWRRGGLQSLRALLGILPAKQETRTDLQTILDIGKALSDTGGQEKTFLILFQNNMELRPGGGFIGSFGILKVKDGDPVSLIVHDSINFDGRIPDTVAAPYPMKETLGVRSWKLRDSNFSADFAENAKQAEDFYHLGNGEEQFDGVIGITTRVLESFLKVTGPVEVPGYEGSFGSENAILDLEYQVEQNYYKQGISFGERKSIMGELSAVIIKKAKELPVEKKYELFKAVLADLHEKDIQVLFKDEALQAQVEKAGWDGKFDQVWNDDFLFLVDSNMNAFKSDLYMEREYDYTVDLSAPEPKAVLRVTYRHTAKEKSYLTKDYQAYARVYVPKGSFIESIAPLSHPVVYGEEFGRKYAGTIVQVPLGSEKTLEYVYKLPKNLKSDWYDLKIQKQPGMKANPVHVTVIKQDGSREERRFDLRRDTVWSELSE